MCRASKFITSKPRRLIILGGYKGMGEGGAVNPPAALANAITDALSPFGITVNQTPITPEWIAMAVTKAVGDTTR